MGRTLTEAEKRRLNRRIRYLCSKQDPEHRSFRTRQRGSGPTGAIQPGAYQPGVFFLGCEIRLSRGAGGFEHIGNVILGLFREAHREDRATAELLEVGR
jgi:hypothetical protein